MPKTTTHVTPAKGLKGFAQNWRNDLIAAFSVSLVALPLSLGIAIAAGVPPMSGIIAVVVGGVITTFLRGSYVAINGPAAGSIAVILGALAALDDGSGRTLNYVMAAVVVSGVLQVVLGVLRFGKYAEIFPSSVIQGILAAIGVIIFSKQVHVALGSDTDATSTIGILLDIPNSVLSLNPFVTIIALISILLLVYHAKISYKLFHFLPAPMWVLVLSIPFAYLFNFHEPHTIAFLGKEYEVGPAFLISLPENLLSSFIFPDFSRMGDPVFWGAVIPITLITSIETLASAKAVDKLDPYKRVTNLNREWIGVGISTIISGMIGGLPVNTVIVRSSVNINNNAKTRGANFYHGLFILLFILLLSPYIQKVPLAALAAILVFTGYRLASPTIFKHAYEQGVEQLLFLSGTLIITLFSNLLWGIVGGIGLALMVHVLLARLPVSTFLRLVINPGIKVNNQGSGIYELKMRGVANFLSMLRIKRKVDVIPGQQHVTVNMNDVRLIDLTVLEFLEEFGRKYQDNEGTFEMIGLQYHIASSQHPLALKSKHSTEAYRLTPRQKKLARMALEHNWQYRHEVDWDISYLQHFQFFETRPIEHKSNVITGVYPQKNIYWEIADITFDEGALHAVEVYNTTVQVIRLPFEIPKFILEEEGIFDKIFDRVMAFSGQRDIDFQLFTKFSSKFLLKGEDETTIRQFFTPSLIRFFENEEIYHIESNGEALLIFKYLRLARADEATKMLAFSEALLERIKGKSGSI